MTQMNKVGRVYRWHRKCAVNNLSISDVINFRKLSKN